ncbi:MAG: heme exporter protein CcmD [Rhodobacteraceae bacterium]|nr:MAG: heme exporter protein CcmD [Paracoccaceae bacterium]
MPDLGKYADTVLLAYAVSFVFLAALIVLTVVKSRKSKQLLARAEAHKNG